MRDNLPRKIWKNECGIVNMDINRGNGTHWVAYIKKQQDILYFDSYGNLQPPVELTEYFQSGGSYNDIRYNYDNVQKFNSYKCGHHCLLFLYNYCC